MRTPLPTFKRTKALAVQREVLLMNLTPLPTFKRRKPLLVQQKVLLMSLIPRKEEAMIVVQLFVLMHNTALGELPPELQFNIMKDNLYFSFAKIL